MRWCTLLLVLIAFLCKGQNAIDDFNTAVQLGQNGKYQEALKLFKSIKNEGLVSASLDYNIGTAYLHLDSIGKSILHLERALRYLPNDQQIQKHIVIARQRMEEAVIPVTPFFLSEWVKKVNGSISLTGWGILSTLFIWIFACLLAVILMKIDWKFGRFNTLFLILSIISIILSASMCFAANQRIKQKNIAILTAPQTELKVGPDALSTTYNQIYEGEKLIILNELEGWFQVELLNRDIGWIKSEMITRI